MKIAEMIGVRFLRIRLQSKWISEMNDDIFETLACGTVC
jgi:hypothetical protein